MTKLAKLIKELCPDGVEYKALEELFDIRNGYTPSKANNEYWTGGTIPWFRMEDIRKNGRVLSNSVQHITESGVKGKLFPANSLIMSTTATIGEHALITVDSLTNQQMTAFSLQEEAINILKIKFVFYCFFSFGEWCKSNVNKNGGISIIGIQRLKNFKIPLPPLPVQEEIVRILDKFTKLEAELEAELEARQKQYEYYRDELLVFGDEVPMVPLREVAKISNGKDHKHLTDGEIPVYGSGGIMRYASKYIYNSKSVLIPRKGSLSSLFYLETPFWTVDTIFYTKIDEEKIIPKYFFYYLQTQRLENLNEAAGVPSLTQTVLNRVLSIPLPPLAVQEEIVKILDRFDALVNNISQGLPAEIEARRKQYEYYRNKLLNFKVKVKKEKKEKNNEQL